MKLFKFEEETWNDSENIRKTFQFGVFKNITIFYVLYETPKTIHYSGGGINILLSFFSSSLFGLDIQSIDNSWSLGFYLFTDTTEES